MFRIPGFGIHDRQLEIPALEINETIYGALFADAVN